MVTQYDKYGYKTTLNTNHAKVHDGNLYMISDYDNDVDIASPKVWRITTHASYDLHCVFRLVSSGSATLVISSGDTYSGAGTSITAFNMNRSSANTINATFYYDSVVDVAGSNILTLRLSDIGETTYIGGLTRSESELILAKNTNYTFTITTDADDTKIHMNLECYETA